MTAGHPDTDALADYAEELLAPQDAAELEAHVSGCADCTSALAELAELSQLLADEPTPPMPADVAARIDQALAEESARKRTEDRQLRRRRTRRTLTRALVGLAAAAVIAVGGKALVGSVGTEHNSAGSAARTAQGGAAASSRVFTRTGLAVEVHQLLAGDVSTASGAAGTHPQAMSGNQQDPGTVSVPSCALTAARQPASALLAAGTGFFEGAPVYALVYPLGTDRLEVVLVRIGCQTPGPTPGTARPGSAEVLLEQTVPRN